MGCMAVAGGGIELPEFRHMVLVHLRKPYVYRYRWKLQVVGSYAYMHSYHVISKQCSKLQVVG